MIKYKKYILLALFVSIILNVVLYLDRDHDRNKYEEYAISKEISYIESAVNKSNFLKLEWSKLSDCERIDYLSDIENCIDLAVEFSGMTTKFFYPLKLYSNEISDLKHFIKTGIPEAYYEDFVDLNHDLIELDEFFTKNNLYDQTQEEIIGNWSQHKEGLKLENLRQ